MELALLVVLGFAVAVLATMLLLRTGERPRLRAPRPPASRRGVVFLEVADDVEADDPSLRRLIESTTRAAFGSDRSLVEVEVRTRGGRVLSLVERTSAAAPAKVVAMPSVVVDPRVARRTTALPHPTAGTEPSHASPAFLARVEIPERRPLIEEFALPAQARVLVVDPNDAVDIVRAILAAGGKRPSVDGDVVVCGDDAIVVLRGRTARPVLPAELTHAYLRFRESGASRGAVISMRFVPPEEIRTREAFAPELIHVGTDAIQRMADAVAIGADPLLFVRPPAPAGRLREE